MVTCRNYFYVKYPVLHYCVLVGVQVEEGVGRLPEQEDVLHHLEGTYRRDQKQWSNALEYLADHKAIWEFSECSLSPQYALAVSHTHPLLADLAVEVLRRGWEYDVQPIDVMESSDLCGAVCLLRQEGCYIQPLARVTDLADILNVRVVWHGLEEVFGDGLLEEQRLVGVPGLRQ